MASVVERHAHDLPSLRDERRIDGYVRRRSRERLDVGVPFFGLELEKLERALDREELDLVSDLIAAVIALAWVALGVFVSELGAERIENVLRYIILGCDKVRDALLALLFGINELLYLWVFH